MIVLQAISARTGERYGADMPHDAFDLIRLVEKLPLKICALATWGEREAAGPPEVGLGWALYGDKSHHRDEMLLQLLWTCAPGTPETAESLHVWPLQCTSLALLPPTLYSTLLFYSPLAPSINPPFLPSFHSSV